MCSTPNELATLSVSLSPLSDWKVSSGCEGELKSAAEADPAEPPEFVAVLSDSVRFTAPGPGWPAPLLSPPWFIMVSTRLSSRSMRFCMSSGVDEPEERDEALRRSLGEA